MEEEKKDPSEKKKRNPDFEINEFFMAKAGKKGFETYFTGSIKREKDKCGKEIFVTGNICGDGRAEIWSRAENENILSENLDAIVEMILNYRLHDRSGASSKIAGRKFFHN